MRSICLSFFLSLSVCVCTITTTLHVGLSAMASQPINEGGQSPGASSICKYFKRLTFL